MYWIISFKVAFLPSFQFQISRTSYLPLELYSSISVNAFATALYTTSPYSLLSTFNFSSFSSNISWNYQEEKSRVPLKKQAAFELSATNIYSWLLCVYIYICIYIPTSDISILLTSLKQEIKSIRFHGFSRTAIHSTFW